MLTRNLLSIGDMDRLSRSWQPTQLAQVQEMVVHYPCLLLHVYLARLLDDACPRTPRTRRSIQYCWARDISHHVHLPPRLRYWTIHPRPIVGDVWPSRRTTGCQYGVSHLQYCVWVLTEQDSDSAVPIFEWTGRGSSSSSMSHLGCFALTSLVVCLLIHYSSEVAC
jgi:hypothetical protein